MNQEYTESADQIITPSMCWDDLVLPGGTTSLLHQIAAQVRQRHTVHVTWGFARRMNRGTGITVLFAGDSGTGKTMAAEVLAQDLQLNLHRINLSAVVSKYIGETEKNLNRLFDVARQGESILFFDEADALFGKRSEVKDSHDRYASIDSNYLLQRMEAHGGLAILATNSKSNLDNAFLRRLRFIVDFPPPDAQDRAAIWQKVFPPEAPIGDLDCGRLATFHLTGGDIHRVALNAAFLAARDHTDITMPAVLTAVRTELHKLDRPVNETDFQ
jgi:SpoVK/Ycf46/Vps4 family AAA+-type ATPase